MNVYSWFDLSLFILLFALFIYVFTRVTITRLHKVYFLFHFFMMLWPLSQFAVDISQNPRYQLFYVSVSFVVMAMLGGGWLFLTLFLTGHADKLGWKTFFISFLPAVIVAIGIVINPAQSFVRPLDHGYIQRTYGSWFWVTMIVLLGYFLLSLYYILKVLYSRNTVRVIKNQVKVTLWGILILAFFGFLDVLLNVILKGWLPIIPGLTSAGIFLSNLFYVFAIIRYNVFEIVSIAHKDILNTIPYGILVLDENETIIEENQVLQSYLNWGVGDTFDMQIFLEGVRTEGNSKVFFEKYTHGEDTHIEIIVDQGTPGHFILQTAPIFAHSHLRIGRTITFQNVTQLRYLVNEMNKKNNLLEERNHSLISIRDELFNANEKLEEMAHTDSLTHCFNRRYLTKQLTQDVMANRRHRLPFSLILLDIDSFKSINDRYGHLIGDEVLRSTVETIQNLLRHTDILARYGGEEFMIYLRHTDKRVAHELAEHIRMSVDANQIKADQISKPISITISLGVLSIEGFEGLQAANLDHPEEYVNELFDAVDKALYRAKENGRNRTEFVS